MSDLEATRRLLREMPFKDEAEVLRGLLSRVRLSREERLAITEKAAGVVEQLREGASAGLMEKFLAEYGLGTEEGVALMCLAEAFLRTPDAPSLDLLIADKIGTGNWQRHLGRAESSLINASTWALMLTGRVFRRKNKDAADLGEVMRGVVRRLGEPIARAAVGEAMKVLGRQFVLGRTIEEALERGSADWKRGLSHSFDMLGEAAKTAKDAYRYFLSYSAAITAIAKHAKDEDPMANPGISVKLSALHPRYETLQRDRVMAELVPRVAALAEQARAANIGFNIDAEEADRLDLSFDVVEAVLRSQSLKGWGGFGVVIQAYAKTASPAIEWVYGLAKKLDRQVAVRLVKGAYWDAEIKLAQVLGLSTYPVFTRKASTDLSYLVCARQLLEANDRIYPQFATHNAHTVAAIQQMAGKDARFEFQRLHGMGEALHDVMRDLDGRRRRIYAPVGVHQDLLAYLVRRLLENGANSSFVHQLLDKAVPAKEIARDPVAILEGEVSLAHDKIPLPSAIFGKGRRNSSGVNLNQPALGEAVAEEMRPFRESRWRAGPGVGEGAPPRPVVSPITGRDQVGEVSDATPGAVNEALSLATSFAPSWAAVSVEERAAMLERAADFYEKHRGELMALATREAGKTRLDGIAEVREAADFLRYYAAEARSTLKARAPLGPIVCISPWNFPLAIFTGQIAAALVAGNPVIAKPAEQTPLIAARAVELLHQAGIAKEALILLPGDGATVGAALTSDPRVKGVCFTGGTDTAQLIDRALAEKGDPNAVLIAETGGLNAMIVDSTALAEQAVRDIVASAFQSAGQRCSALRVLYLQEDVAPRVLEMLEGAASELVIGDPWQAATDVGPVIDREAEATILAHCEKMEGEGRLLFKLRKPDTCPEGTFVSPAAYLLEKIGQLSREIFGPILHVVTYKSEELDQVVDQINATGYGLTLGVHSRIDQRVDRVCDRARVGNIYVNRNQIGAVVGSQPFGGEGLSGTGPKAGGPHYLTRFTKPLGQGKPDFKAVPLPGPTGESNLYKLSPRGTVLCAGPTADDCKRQAALATSLGNKVLAEGDVLKLAAEAEIDAVLYDGPDKAALRSILAKRQGARVPLLSSTDDPVRLCVEQVVSEDTTAAGGNASLLAATS